MTKYYCRVWKYYFSTAILPIRCLGMLESDATRLRKSSKVVRFSYTQSEGYNNSLFDCESIKRIKVKFVIASGFNSIMYGAKADLSKLLLYYFAAVDKAVFG